MANLFSALFSATDEQLMWRVKLQDDAEAFASLMSRWQKEGLVLTDKSGFVIPAVERLREVAQAGA